jgi:alpha-1,2-mannosyltransferase
MLKKYTDSFFMQQCKTAFFIVVLGLVCVEGINCVRVWVDYNGGFRRFPYDYVSQGIWSFGGFLRPLDTYNTDIAPALRASSRLLKGDSALYKDFNKAGSSFIYPPSAALLLSPYGMIVNRQSGDLSMATQLFDLTGRLCVLCTLLIIFLAQRNMFAHWKHAAVLFILFACFYPLRWMVVCLQAQALITLMAVVGILAFGRSYSVASGVAIGLAFCLKPHLGIIFLFALFRREWRFCAGMVTSSFLVIMGSIILTGFSPWRTYLVDIMPVLSRGYAYYPNQSINGIVNRWVGHAPQFVFPPPSQVVALFTSLSAVLFGLLAVLPRSSGLQLKRDTEISALTMGRSDLHIILLRELDLAIALLCVTLASPIAWEHHFAWTIGIFLILLDACRIMNSPQKIILMLPWSFILLGAYYMPVRSASSGIFSLVNSPNFFGAILLLLLLWLSSHKISNDELAP